VTDKSIGVVGGCESDLFSKVFGQWVSRLSWLWCNFTVVLLSSFVVDSDGFNSLGCLSHVVSPISDNKSEPSPWSSKLEFGVLAWVDLDWFSVDDEDVISDNDLDVDGWEVEVPPSTTWQHNISWSTFTVADNSEFGVFASCDTEETSIGVSVALVVTHLLQHFVAWSVTAWFRDDDWSP